MGVARASARQVDHLPAVPANTGIGFCGQGFGVEQHFP